MAGLTPEQESFYYSQAISMGVPSEWIAEFLSGNPGDHHRILEAYRGEAGGQGGAIIAAGGGIFDPGTQDYAAPGLPARPPDSPPPPMLLPGTGGAPGLFGGGFSLTTLIVIAGAALAAWYLLRKR